MGAAQTKSKETRLQKELDALDPEFIAFLQNENTELTNKRKALQSFNEDLIKILYFHYYKKRPDPVTPKNNVIEAILTKTNQPKRLETIPEVNTTRSKGVKMRTRSVVRKSQRKK